ncbi:MAG: hypothetical protein EBT06_12015 [Gammaproteobacteria bacterium]|nr:hypothetical protein [Gammaproteobacteria bacterium]NBT45613.1 hypothetical protein [Gammaproteobacteria bacterium]NBY21444.1 hypothetical protein [Gammaproteobacteria bacterium]
MIQLNYTNDFNVTFPGDYSIYLPAINETYAPFTDRQLDVGRAVPQGFTIADLAFWSGQSALWNYPYYLHSIGCYTVGKDTRGPLFRRAPNTSFFLGDSGGFQIGKGTLSGLSYEFFEGMHGIAAVSAWEGSYDAKRWIIEWLDRYADYAMTLDMPLWAMTNRGAKSPFHNCTEQQLTDMTVRNLQLIQKIKKGHTRWLNVVQGSNWSNTQRWWQAVNWFRDGGWSLAGTAGWLGGLADMLRTLVMMRDDNAFDLGQDVLHVLGMSQTKWAIFLTAIQRELRSVNPGIQITYDSATPFKCGGRHDQYAVSPALGYDRKDWAIKLVTLKQTSNYADQNNPQLFPEPSSPLGKMLEMHHLVCRDDEFEKHRLDSLSNMMLMNHNAWVYLDAMRRANEDAFGPIRNIPEQFEATLDAIADVFAAQNPMDRIDAYQSLFDQVAPAAINDPEVDMDLEFDDADEPNP